MSNNPLLLLLLTSLVFSTIAATARTNGIQQIPMGVSPPSVTRDHYFVMHRSNINKRIGVDGTIEDEEEAYSHIELKSLVPTHGGNNNGVIWLRNENSVVSHHKLKNAQITLRGGAEESQITDEFAISSPESFDKKKSTTASVNNPASGFAKWYMKQMEAHELRTKCISAGLLGLIGDVCAQEVGHYFTQQPSLGSDGVLLPDSLGFLGFLHRLDKQRMIAMFCDGALTTGPLLHFVYAFYESILPIPEVDEGLITNSDEKRKAVRKRFCTALIHVLFDNFIMAILYVFLMMVITATLEGKYLTIPHELRHDFFPAVQASWKASLMGLAPMQLLSFHFLPMELRVLAVNVQDVVWVTVMSYVTHRNRH
ncbi:hypothetical protein ACHAWX_002553 [Stephanocyclus meneghinianus]